MKIIRNLLILIIALSALAVVASFPIYNSFQSKARLIQRIQYNESMAELLGEPGPKVGSPQMYIITDEKAFLKERGENGVLLVNEAYLTEHKIYPLQLQSVQYIAITARWVCIGTIVVSALLLVLMNKKLKAKQNNRKKKTNINYFYPDKT